MKRYLEQHQDQDEMYSRVIKRSPEFLENGQITPKLCPNSAAELRHLSGRGLNKNHQIQISGYVHRIQGLSTLDTGCPKKNRDPR